MAINQEEMVGVLLASTASWQALCGTADLGEALRFVHELQAEEESRDEEDEPAPYPRAVIEEVERQRSAAGTATWRGRGAVLLSIEAQAPDEQTSIAEQRRWWKGLVDDLESEMRVISASRATPSGYSHSHFCLKDIAYAVEPFLKPDYESDDVAADSDVVPRKVWCVQFRLEY